MAQLKITRGLFVTLLFFVIISLIKPSNANWYGKRGDKVDESLLQILQGSFPDMVDRQMDAQMTLRTIAKLLQDYELRQLEAGRGKDVSK